MPQADPFRHVYTGVDQTCKRAVGEDVVVRLRQLDLTHSPSLALARDIFIFSYCTRGMAFVDIAFLRNQDIVGARPGSASLSVSSPASRSLSGAMPVQGAYPAMFFRCSVRTIRSGRFPNTVRPLTIIIVG